VTSAVLRHSLAMPRLSWTAPSVATGAANVPTLAASSKMMPLCHGISACGATIAGKWFKRTSIVARCLQNGVCKVVACFMCPVARQSVTARVVSVNVLWYSSATPISCSCKISHQIHFETSHTCQLCRLSRYSVCQKLVRRISNTRATKEQQRIICKLIMSFSFEKKYLLISDPINF